MVSKTVENFVDKTVSRQSNDGIVIIRVQVFGNLKSMPTVCCGWWRMFQWMGLARCPWTGVYEQTMSSTHPAARKIGSTVLFRTECAFPYNTQLRQIEGMQYIKRTFPP
jgi:hypothetical protein